MIKIKDKKDCCGCASCVQACPKQCISFKEDEQGFSYPSVNEKDCIDCGLCEKVCPILNQNEKRIPLKVYAAINPNEEIRLKSSSGGIFTMIAESVINEGGVVFGARFNENWEVIHDYTETIEGLDVFRGSKYVQSRIGETYKQVQEFLKIGRKVLFSGTPCQVAGLKRFLRKDHELLFTVDVVCHGVPSPLVWREYLNKKVLCPNVIIETISFRDKFTGWNKYGFAVHGKTVCEVGKKLTSMDCINMFVLRESRKTNMFMQSFLKDLCLRPSCYRCGTKCGKSGSDITLADYWGVTNYHPEFDDDKGTSLVLVNNEKGKNMYLNINTFSQISTYNFGYSHNPSLEKSAKETNYVTEFWKKFHSDGFNRMKILYFKLGTSIYSRAYRFLQRFILLK